MSEPLLATADIFPWNDNFVTGIEIIDLQHRKLVELVNTLANHLAFHADHLTLTAIFDELTAYAAYHFETEEAIWRQHLAEQAPQALDKHLQAHQDFVNSISKLMTHSDDQNAVDTCEDILSFLSQWLAFHILDSDKHLASIVLGLNDGLRIEDAKIRADRERGGAMQMLIKTILSMYDYLSSRTIHLMKEITKRRELEEKLQLAANVMQNTLDAICVTDASLRIIEVNPVFCQSSGCDPQTGIGQDLRIYKSGLADRHLFENIERAIMQHGHWSGEVKSLNPDGKLESEWLTLSVVSGSDGLIGHYIAVFSNVRQLLKRQKNLERNANHDALTGLPNRVLLADRLQQAITRNQRNGLTLGVCYLDLDGFKPVNDQHGHAAGDELLREVANRYQRLLRNNDTVARIGGDEFVVLLEDLASLEDCEKILQRILKEVSKPIKINEHEVSVSASIGLALFPQHSRNPEQLLHLADQAMYKAKKNGKSQFQIAD